MKKLIFLMSFFVVIVLCANGVAPTHQWRWNYYYVPGMPDGLFDKAQRLDGTLTLPDKRVVKAQKFVYPRQGKIDLYKVLKQRPKVLERTVVTSDFEVEKAQKIVLGLGVDWKCRLYCNGRKVFDSMICGNDAIPPSNNDHYVQLDLKSGRNQLIWEVFGGSYEFWLCAKLKNIPVLEVLYQPWVMTPDSAENAVSIVFALNRPAPCGVDFRVRGEKQWKRIYNNLGGQIRRDLSVHSIRLTDLEPDKVYEYKLVVMDETRNFALIPQKIYTFRSAPAMDKKQFSFLASSDIQFPAPRRQALLKKLFDFPEAQQCDFFAFIGDVDWNSNFNQTIVEEFVNYYCDAAGRDKPLVMVRGNHEYYGRDAGKYFDYFPAPEPGREGYYMFRYGETCFLVLDFGDDAPGEAAPGTRFLNDLEPYFAAEAKWLRQAVKMDMFRTARYRIVLAHATPLGYGYGFMPDNVRKLIDPLFAGKTPEYRIHLWIGGHVHRPFRSVPGQNRCFWPLNRKNQPPVIKHPAIGEKYQFPVLIMGGPNSSMPENLQFTNMLVNVNSNALEVIHRDVNNQVFDHISITPDGKVQEIMRKDFFVERDYPGVAAGK